MRHKVVPPICRLEYLKTVPYTALLISNGKTTIHDN